VNDICESPRAGVTATITGPCSQPPPTITTRALTTQTGGIITLDLVPLISTANNNLDINSIQVTMPPSSGANASVVNGMLTISYTGIAFAGIEQITIQACDLNGNCAAQQFNIEVAGDIVVYNAISPGGANPTLIIMNIELLPETKNNQVTIYDRWQNEVWRGTNYDNSTMVFNGTSDRGSDLPTGTYFYKIEFNGGKKTKTGFISLKR
jgi:gliding motility-associated-like protein